MFSDTSFAAESSSDGLDDQPCVRLRANHSSYPRAAELLTVLGGRKFIPAVGAVYAFKTATARDAALDRARREMGWTVGASFDGRPWLLSDPAARWLP